MEQTKNILPILLYLLDSVSRIEKTGQKAVIDTRNMKIAYSVGAGTDDIQLNQIGENSPADIEFDRNPENFVSFADFTENSRKVQALHGILADIERKYYGEVAENLRNSSGEIAEILQSSDRNTADNSQNNISTSADDLQQLIGKGIIDRRKVSGFYTGELQKLIQKIEKVTAKIVRNTSKISTQQNAAKRYDEAVLIASSNETDKIQKIRGILNSLNSSSDKQDRRHKQNQKSSKKWLTWLIAILITFAVLFCGYIFFIKSYFESDILNLSSKDTFAPTLFIAEPHNLTINEIEDAILNYNRKSNNKIFSWRKGMIIDEFNGSDLSKKEFEEILPELRTKDYTE